MKRTRGCPSYDIIKKLIKNGKGFNMMSSRDVVFAQMHLKAFSSAIVNYIWLLSD